MRDQIEMSSSSDSEIEDEENNDNSPSLLNRYGNFLDLDKDSQHDAVSQFVNLKNRAIRRLVGENGRIGNINHHYQRIYSRIKIRNQILAIVNGIICPLLLSVFVTIN